MDDSANAHLFKDDELEPATPKGRKETEPESASKRRKQDQPDEVTSKGLCEQYNLDNSAFTIIDPNVPMYLIEQYRSELNRLLKSIYKACRRILMVKQLLLLSITDYQSLIFLKGDFRRHDFSFRLSHPVCFS